MSNTIINTNTRALNSHRALTSVGNRQARSSERLSTGQRINRAADDAAGLAISEKMRSQIRGLDQATRNSQDGISLIQTAEGALEEVHAILQRTRELTNQASNDTLTSEDREKIAVEVAQLLDEIDNIAQTTEFNGKSLFMGDDGTGTGGPLVLEIQTGANAGQRLSVSINIMDTAGLGLDTFMDDFNAAIAADDLTTGQTLSSMLSTLDNALSSVSELRANLGAYQNRLDHTINNLQVASENLSAANSRIRDTDMAAEMMALTQANVLQQAATSMLAQANQAPQSVLQLLN
jgi:flagellin